MSRPHEPVDNLDGGIQFDRAEYTEGSPPGSFCRECREPLRDEYYDVGGNVICPTCLANRSLFRSRLGRGLKALLFGSIAAAVGAGIYRMVMFGTGWNFSLVAILVGYTVGGAVRTGSGDRGGRHYQILAVFLTYSALVGMFVPDLWQALARGTREGREVRKGIEKGDPAGRKAVPGRKADAKRAGDVDRPDAQGRADASAVAETRPAAPDVQGRPGEAGRRRSPPSLMRLFYLVGLLLLTSLLLLGLIYATPVVVGIHSPISLLIFGVALWRAWVMTRASEMPVTGPYRVRR